MSCGSQGELPSHAASACDGDGEAYQRYGRAYGSGGAEVAPCEYREVPWGCHDDEYAYQEEDDPEGDGVVRQSSHVSHLEDACTPVRDKQFAAPMFQCSHHCLIDD